MFTNSRRFFYLNFILTVYETFQKSQILNKNIIFLNLIKNNEINIRRSGNIYIVHK